MIKYPNKKVLPTTYANNNKLMRSTSKGNKGISFEKLINDANTFYVNNDIAYIYKKPTPIKILKTRSYKKNFEKKVEIEKAVFEQKSTTDYNGLYKGFYIDFEAKETCYNTFNVKSNLHKHQRQHLENIYNHGGVSFLIVRFTKFDKIYILNVKYILNFKDSLISHDFFKENGIEVEQNKSLYLDYLKAVDAFILKEQNE